MLQFMIPCLFGLESLVGDEIRRLGLTGVQVENGHVLCQGEWKDLCRLNLNLRCGERVLLQVGKERAETFDELYEAAARQPWEDFIPRDGQFPVKGYSLHSKLFSLPNCQKIIKKAAAVRLGGKYGLEQLPETGELYQIQFAMRNDVAEFYLDTSGPGLRKRGYRAVSLEAPLRETLAAAMVLLTRYRGRDPLCDPFCGSGTIPIEAALIAKNRAPGLDRRFDAQRWAVLPSSLWMEAAEEAMDKEFHGTYEIWGGDIDPRAVALAQDNARKAGVEDTVRFEQADATRFHWGGPYGRIVTNPPYGERLLDKQAAEQLYRAFGAAVRKLPDTWRVAVLSSHTEFERSFGAEADRKRKLYNGMIKCDLFQYGRK
ncbi:MAG: class I SAM-dependent RNA methyltransferase [Oscillospiraceae bacterium]